MTADRYSGPFENACKGVNTCSTDPCYEESEDALSGPDQGEASDTSTISLKTMTLVATVATVASLI